MRLLFSGVSPKEESDVEAITITPRSSKFGMQICRAWSSLSLSTYHSDYGGYSASGFDSVPSVIQKDLLPWPL